MNVSTIIFQFLRVFLVGGLICVVAQIIIDKTKLTSARILVLFLVIGVALGAFGLYEPLVNWGRSGATIPITGFGYALAKGVTKEIDLVRTYRDFNRRT